MSIHTIEQLLERLTAMHKTLEEITDGPDRYTSIMVQDFRDKIALLHTDLRAIERFAQDGPMTQ